MTTDKCGSTDTNDGEPCQHSASRDDGYCHIHTDIEEDQTVEGRPSKLDDVYDDVMEGAKRGLTYEGIARVAGIGRSTLDDWRRENEEFNRELEQKRAVAEQRIVERVEDQRPEFLLERSFGYTKEQEIEHTGDAFDLTLAPEEKEQLDEMFNREPSTSTDGE